MYIIGKVSFAFLSFIHVLVLGAKLYQTHENWSNSRPNTSDLHN